MANFSKWDIVYPTRFPESIYCNTCKNSFLIPYIQMCSHCKSEQDVSNIIDKIRPCILWIDKSRWFKNMTFGIPLSSSHLYSDNYNEFVKLEQISLVNNNPQYNKPFRVVIHQATRIDGSAFSEKDLIGKLTDSVITESIEIKLLSWLFPDLVE